MNTFINKIQIPLRWFIHGIFFHRVFQMIFTNHVSKKQNQIVEREFRNLNQYGLNQEAREKKIIVSLTTIPQRFPKIKFVITRMMNQTIKPDRIIVYLDEARKNEYLIDKDF